MALGLQTASLALRTRKPRNAALLPAERMGYLVIGQVRKDTALYLAPPARPGKRGRPRKYGTRMTPEAVALPPETSQRLLGVDKKYLTAFAKELRITGLSSPEAQL